MNFLRSPLFWFIILIAGGLSVLAVIKGHHATTWGFKEVVKQPEYWTEMSRAQEAAEAAAEEARHWSNEEVATRVKDFVLNATTSRDAGEQAQVLRALGARTHAAVLALLSDPSRHVQMVKPTGTALLPEAPFNRACDLLGDAPEEVAVEPLTAFLNDPSAEIRKDAALAIAKTGAPSITPYVTKAFYDSDDYVRAYALMGLRFSLNRSGLAEEARRELVPEVVALLKADRNSDKAAEILYRLDRGEAEKLFLSEEVFTPQSPILVDVLTTLVNAKYPVPRARLLELIASLEKGEMKYPQSWALGQALHLLGQEQQSEDRDFLRARTSHAEEEVARGAAAGLLSSFGLEDFEQRMEEKKYDALSEPQRLYSAVLECDGEIDNGGLAQYFVNSSGDHWRDALAGYQAMGFESRYKILHDAVAKFGSNGPSPDRKVRQDQLSKLYRKDDTLFDALDSQYYKCPEVIEVHTTEYVLKNPDAFR